MTTTNSETPTARTEGVSSLSGYVPSIVRCIGCPTLDLVGGCDGDRNAQTRQECYLHENADKRS